MSSIDSYSDICYLGTDELIIFVSFPWMIWVDLPFLIYLSIYLSIFQLFGFTSKELKALVDECCLVQATTSGSTIFIKLSFHFRWFKWTLNLINPLLWCELLWWCPSHTFFFLFFMFFFNFMLEYLLFLSLSHINISKKEDRLKSFIERKQRWWAHLYLNSKYQNRSLVTRI